MRDLIAARGHARARLGSANTSSTNCRISGAERRDIGKLLHRRTHARLRAAARKCLRLMSNWAGSAPWKLKIDCFSSPTAKIVRGAARLVARALPGEKLLRQLAHDVPIARGWCPALRRSGCGRGRRRACRAPSRTRRAFEQMQGLDDQIVIVEHAARAFGARHIRGAPRSASVSAASASDAAWAARQRSSAATKRARQTDSK